MAQMQFQKHIVNYCPNCGEAFLSSQPDDDAVNNIIECGDGELGCGFKFIVKKVD